MKFFRNYIIVILFLTIILLVLQKAGLFPSFSEFLSYTENREEKIKYIVSSIKQLEPATTVYFIDQELTDSNINKIKYSETHGSWFQYSIQLKENFTENMVDIDGRKIKILLPKPQITDGLIKINPDKNIIDICETRTQKMIDRLMKNMGYREIKIEFSDDFDSALIQ